ncbi:MAG: RIP metalloprotease RseP [Alphaproteobacteria bacterium]
MSGFMMTLFWFLVVLTPVVFVHEFGHFWIARRNGVRVEAFSIGFGKEIFGFTDRRGTRWKFSLIPLGGYVKMFGQNDLAPDEEGAESLTEQERAECFFNKRLGQKAAIVVAGPAANFLFAIVVFALMFTFLGQPFTPARVAEVVPGSAAERAGLRQGDLMIEVEGRSIQRFEEVQQLVRLHPGIEIDLVVLREGEHIALKATPEARVEDDGLGEEQRIGVLGVMGVGREFKHHDPVTAIWQSARETTRLVSITLTALGQIVSGDRGTAELGGPVRIAQMSGVAAEAGLANLVIFAAFLSVNLGLINLFPVPLLDGGHLLFYGYEAIRGRPAGARAQELGLKIGLVLVLGLMVFATLNDLVRLPLIKQFVALIS